MHENEIVISDDIVKTLVSEQFPEYDALPIKKINSTGTVNAIYRLGEKLYVRLPRLAQYNTSITNEWRVLPYISKNITLAVPQIVGMGKPNAVYPLNWGIYVWIEGEIYNNILVNEMETAEILAQFIIEMHSAELTDEAPRAGRKPLLELDKMTTTAITECKRDIDVKKALDVWYELRDTDPWDGNSVWIHADLLKPNLIVSNGKLSAIIDFGSAGIGDPAFDIIPAWTVLTDRTRDIFKDLLNVEDCIWRRAKAYALHQAALIIPYYRKSNPRFVEQAKNTINNIIT